MEKEQLDKRKVITAKGPHNKAAWSILEQVIEATKEGYVLPPEDKRHSKDRPNLSGRQLKVVMYPADYEIPSPGGVKVVKTAAEYLEEARQAEQAHIERDAKKDELLAELEGLSKKAELSEFAERNKIDIPVDKKHPQAIAAYIKSKLS